MSHSDYTYRGYGTSGSPTGYYSSKRYKSIHSGKYQKYQEEKPMTYHGAFQLRVLICIVLFAAFVIMDGRQISQPQKEFLYERLEESMSRQTAETWASGIKTEYRKIREEIY